MSDQPQAEQPQPEPESTDPATAPADPPAASTDPPPSLERHVPDLAPVVEPVATGLAMKGRHPVLVWLVWPLITLGIYHFAWYYKIHREMAEFDRRRTVPTVGPMLVLLLLGWTVVAPLVSYYNTGERIRHAQRAAGLHPECSAVIGMLLMLVFNVGTLYYQLQLNKITETYEVPEGAQIPLYK